MGMARALDKGDRNVGQANMEANVDIVRADIAEKVVVYDKNDMTSWVIEETMPKKTPMAVIDSNISGMAKTPKTIDIVENITAVVAFDIGTKAVLRTTNIY